MSLSSRRSFLFVPGDSPPKLKRAPQSAADAIIFDLEDGLVPDQKASGRQQVADTLAAVDRHAKEYIVRINAPGTPYYEDDLATAVSAGAAGVLLPKVAAATEIRDADEHLQRLEAAAGRPVGDTAIWVLVESAAALVNLAAIAAASSRLAGLILGAEDLAADIGARRTSEGAEILHARSAVITHATAFGLTAVDTIFVTLDDAAGLQADADLARQLGFDGKLAIHPGQLAAINRAFSPSPDEVAAARELVAAYERFAASGVGVFTWQGRMIDRPAVLAARRLLDRAPPDAARDA